MCFLRDSLSFESIVPSHLKKRHFKVINIVFCEIFNFFYFFINQVKSAETITIQSFNLQGKNFHFNFFSYIKYLKE